MFIFRHPGRSNFMKSYRELHEEAMKQVNNYIWAVTHNVTDEEDDHMEQSASKITYYFDFPGVSPERIGVKLSADRKSIAVSVDGTTQKVIIPPYIPGLKPEDLSVKMEHGRLTVIISRQSASLTKEDEINIPVNGKQFLQE